MLPISGLKRAMNSPWVVMINPTDEGATPSPSDNGVGPFDYIDIYVKKSQLYVFSKPILLFFGEKSAL